MLPGDYGGRRSRRFHFARSDNLYFMGNVDDTVDLSTSDRPGESARFGDYELLGEIGRGAMGIVYRARLKGTNLVVALKEVRPEEVDGGVARRRFRHEIEAASGLRHPHIVPIFHVGENADGSYYTMALIEGGSLEKHLRRFQNNPRAAAAIVAKIAWAIHHAHQRRVLHRDLKPANVLLDEAGEPHVADFGLATRLDAEGSATAKSVSGSLPWMAPEAVRGEPALSTAVDVWAMGVILYELLTGTRPFNENDRSALRKKIIEGEPSPPRDINRKIDRDLDAICRQCLAKDPEKRYESASALAVDLERWLRHEPVRARWAGPFERSLKLTRRHPGIASGIAFMAILLIASTVAAISVAHDQERRVTEEVCLGNEFAARHVSSTLFGRFNQFGDAVEAAADNAKLHDACKSSDWPAVEEILRKRLIVAPPGPRAPPFATAFVLDPQGTIRVEVPQTNKVVGENFAERDYFRGAVARADSENRVYLSKVFTSKNDGLDKLAICVPFRLAANGPVWVLGATVPTDADLGLGGLHDDRRKAVLLAPRETNDGSMEYVVLIHPGFMAREPSVPFPGDRLRRFGETYLPDDDYSDPVSARHSEYSGRWLAGFAPVPDTDLIVLVQQPYEAAIAPQRAFLRRFADWVAAVAGLAGLFVAGLWLRGRRALSEPLN
jgi:eukaryotic-like serine/threonine-protein kinase